MSAPTYRKCCPPSAAPRERSQGDHAERWPLAEPTSAARPRRQRTTGEGAAQRRLQQAADALVERPLGFALDGDAPDAVSPVAIRDALDRAGLNPKTAIELEVKPYEQVLEGIAGIALHDGEVDLHLV
jgi:hypothetical protein